MLRAGLIGFPSAGKTSLFQLLTSVRDAPARGGKTDANVGVSRVPDDRLDALTALFNPRKRVPATVEFADIAGVGGAKGGAQALLDVAPFRNADALLHVVQPFEKIGTKWVAYGISNLTTYGSDEDTQQAVVPQFTFTRNGSGRWEVTRVKVTPTWMQYQPAARVIDLARAVNDVREPAERRAGYARIQKQITQYVNLRGALAAGLQVS